ncbi:MAG: DUF3048 domain-containing protein [Firmicutes bacterium]|nr:DUF3048 domain-containing protein [Bacillota bacterium]
MRGSRRPHHLIAVCLVAALVAVILSAGCRPGLGLVSGPGGGVAPSGGGSPGEGGSGGAENPGGGSGAQTPPAAEPPGSAICPLCGLKTGTDAVLHRPLAVVVDNSTGGRPQSGLGDACLVYELPVEGGITRFLAFFLHTDAAAIGPVRSLRPYMLDLAMPLGAVMAHVGGSPAALAELASERPAAMSIDELEKPQAFWRSSERRTPYNCFTSTSLQRSASRSSGYEGTRLTRTTPAAFNFAPPGEKPALPQGQSVGGFALHYTSTYRVTYDYDSSSGRWLRYVGGAAHKDAATGRQLGATTVIVLFVPTEAIAGDPEGRLAMDLDGGGQAWVFCAGQSFRVRWGKSGRLNPITFQDGQGNPLTLPAGPVWVLVAPPGTPLETR